MRAASELVGEGPGSVRLLPSFLGERKTVASTKSSAGASRYPGTLKVKWIYSSDFEVTAIIFSSENSGHYNQVSRDLSDHLYKETIGSGDWSV